MIIKRCFLYLQVLEVSAIINLEIGQISNRFV